jgi:hypothetical protein
MGVHQLIGPPRSFLRRQRSVGIGLTLEFRAKPAAGGLGRCRPVPRTTPPLCSGDPCDQYAIIPALRTPRLQELG